MYYIYRHIRLDTNQPFYIGKGTVNLLTNKHHVKYYRAFSYTSRHPIWHRIYNKTQIRVDIIFESDSLEETYNKEIEFISLYGRMSLGTGTLSNISAGGLDVSYTKHHTSLKKPVYQYGQNGNFITYYNSKLQALKPLSSRSICALNKALKDGSTLLGYKWFYEYQGLTIEPFTTYVQKLSKLITLSNGVETLRFESIKATARHLKTSSGYIRRIINNPSRKVRGYYYVKDTLDSFVFSS